MNYLWSSKSFRAIWKIIQRNSRSSWIQFVFRQLEVINEIFILQLYAQVIFDSIMMSFRIYPKHKAQRVGIEVSRIVNFNLYNYEALSFAAWSRAIFYAS